MILPLFNANVSFFRSFSFKNWRIRINAHNFGDVKCIKQRNKRPKLEPTLLNYWTTSTTPKYVPTNIFIINSLSYLFHYNGIQYDVLQWIATRLMNGQNRSRPIVSSISNENTHSTSYRYRTKDFVALETCIQTHLLPHPSWNCLQKKTRSRTKYDPSTVRTQKKSNERLSRVATSRKVTYA